MTIQGALPTRKPPRLFEVWEAVRARLADSSELEAVLTPDTATETTDRIVLAGTEQAAKERPAGVSDTAPWGWLWIIPITQAWNVPELVGRDTLAPFLIRVDFHVPAGSSFPLQRRMEAAHEVVFDLLHGWSPTGLTFAQVVEPMHREVRPQPMPLWDAQRGIWYLSAVYHAYVEPAPLSE